MLQKRRADSDPEEMGGSGSRINGQIGIRIQKKWADSDLEELGGSGSNLGSQKIELSLKFLHVNKKALNGICLCLQVATFGLGQLRFTCLNILPEAEEKCSVPDLAKLDLPFIWSTSPVTERKKPTLDARTTPGPSTSAAQSLLARTSIPTWHPRAS